MAGLVDWNPDYLIFNDSIIEKSAGSPRWTSLRMASETDEVRKKFRSRPIWHLDLSGLLLTPRQYEELLAFQYQIEGMIHPFLVRNVRNCMLQTFDGKPAFLGSGNGANRVFQLQKQRPIQSRNSIEIIRYPNIDYPALLDMNGRPYTVLPKLEIYVGGYGDGITKGTLIPYSNLDVDRNTGRVEILAPSPAPAQGQRVDAYGGFFTLMVSNQDEIPVTPKGAMFLVDKGTSFSETVGNG